MSYYAEMMATCGEPEWRDRIAASPHEAEAIEAEAQKRYAARVTDHFTAPFYKLMGEHVIPVHDYGAYKQWWRTADRVVARTELNGYLVSTVFHGLGRLWFETMAFRDGSWSELWSAYSHSLEEAKAKHEEAVEYIKSECL